jgi:hypothetical protein
LYPQKARQKADRIKAQAAASELDGCTFQPKLNPKSAVLATARRQASRHFLPLCN